jgi:hypothetical protein
VEEMFTAGALLESRAALGPEPGDLELDD